MEQVSRVELRVSEDGHDRLIYTFGTVSEAAEMICFLRDFFESATFVVQPVRH